MDKKGEITLTELAYLLLAILLIAAITLAGSRGFSMIQTEKEKAQAKGTLNQLSNFLDSLKEGGQDTFIIYSPAGYYLESFDSYSQCNTQCICICKKKDCSGEENYCRDINKPLKEKLDSRIGVGSILVINNKDNYQFMAAIEDVFENEIINVSQNCSGPLVDIGNGYQIRESVKPAFLAAMNYAKSLKVDLIVSDAYRTVQQQQNRLEVYGSDIACTPRNTTTGFGLNCPHVTGCAIDVCFGYLCERTARGLPANLNNNDTLMLKQIMEHAGFKGISSEYWHFEYGLSSSAAPSMGNYLLNKLNYPA